MSSTTRTTGAITPVMSAATIADIRTRIISGGRIYSSDVTAIYNGFNSAGHTHDYYDQYTQFKYGNINGGTTQGTEYTGTFSSTSAALSSNIKASDINNINSMAAGFQNHTHTYIDY